MSFPIEHGDSPSLCWFTRGYLFNQRIRYPLPCRTSVFTKWLGRPPNLQVEQAGGGWNEDQCPEHGQEASLASSAVIHDPKWVFLLVVSSPEKEWNHHPEGEKVKESLEATSEPKSLDDFHLSIKAASKFQETLMQTLAETSQTTICKWKGHFQIYFRPTFQVGLSPKHRSAAPPSQQQGLAWELKVIKQGNPLGKR